MMLCDKMVYEVKDLSSSFGECGMRKQFKMVIMSIVNDTYSLLRFLTDYPFCGIIYSV